MLATSCTATASSVTKVTQHRAGVAGERRRMPLAAIVVACIFLTVAHAAAVQTGSFEHSHARRLLQAPSLRVKPNGACAFNAPLEYKKDACSQKFTTLLYANASEQAFKNQISLELLKCINPEVPPDNFSDPAALNNSFLIVPCDHTAAAALSKEFGDPPFPSPSPSPTPSPVPSPAPPATHAPLGGLPNPNGLNQPSGRANGNSNAATDAGNANVATDEFGWVAAHNRVRALHQNTGPVEWSEEIAAVAQAWVQGCPDGHNPNLQGLGENLAMGMVNGPGTVADRITQLWYDEIMHWDTCSRQQTTGETGHFTQVVWKATTKIGCAMAERCGVSVCDYSPAGNSADYFNQVAPLKTDQCT